MVSKYVIYSKETWWLSVPLSHLHIIQRQYLGMLLRDGRCELTSRSTQSAFNCCTSTIETTEDSVQS